MSERRAGQRPWGPLTSGLIQTLPASFTKATVVGRRGQEACSAITPEIQTQPSPPSPAQPPLCIFSRQDPVGFLLSELWYQKLIPPSTVDPELKRASGGTCQHPPMDGRNPFLSIPSKLSTGFCLTISQQKEAHALTRGPGLRTAVIVFRQQVLWEIEAAMGCGKTCL